MSDQTINLVGAEPIDLARTNFPEPAASASSGPAKTLTDPRKAEAFVKAVFGNNVTDRPICFSSFDNDRNGDHPSKHLTTRDLGELSSFMSKYDRDGRAMFFSVGTIRNAAKVREKANIAEVSMLHADIDLKDVDDSRADVERKLKAFRRQLKA